MRFRTRLCILAFSALACLASSPAAHADASGGAGAAYLSANTPGTIVAGTGKNFGFVLQTSAAPEPGTLALLLPVGAAAAGVVRVRRRQKV